MSVYEAIKRVKETIKNSPNEPVPLHIRNAPTSLMKKLNYGAEYVYNPSVETEDGEASAQKYLPDSLAGQRFFYYQCTRRPSIDAYREGAREMQEEKRGNKASGSGCC